LLKRYVPSSVVKIANPERTARSVVIGKTEEPVIRDLSRSTP